MSLGPAFDAKEQVRQAIDIVELVGSYLTLRPQGRSYVALCPWHDDTRPSLHVNPERQLWRCWVCNVGGDIFSFVMRREGVGFREALQMLADRAGINLAPAGGRVLRGGPEDKQTLYQAARWAEQQFHECLLHGPEAEPARQYLLERGINAATIERFCLGYAPDRWQWLIDRAKATPFSLKVLEAVGLAARSSTSGQYYDRFKGRLIFPIRDVQSRAIAFGGRILPQAGEKAGRNAGVAKYINCPETRLFSKSEQLYGLDVARTASMDRREIIVVEGYTDVLMAHQSGLPNVVAVLGTALGRRHINVLRRYADTVYLVLDGDAAGRRRTSEILELFIAADVDLRIIALPGGLDPCDYLLQHGKAGFDRLRAEALDAMQYKIQSETAGLDVVHQPHQANQALERILQTLAKAPRATSAEQTKRNLREQQLLTHLAARFDVDLQELWRRLCQLRSRPAGQARALAAGQGPQIGAESLDAKSAELIEILLAYPAQAQAAADQIPASWVASAAARTIYETIIGLHRRGQPTDLVHVMTQLEDADLKGLLAELDERAQQKAAQAGQDAPTRLQELVEAFKRDQLRRQVRQQAAGLKQSSGKDEEQVLVLQQIIQQERSRQGISSPTDG